jgi:hypothetical protein
MQTLEVDLWRVGVDGEPLERLMSDKLDVRYATPIDDRTLIYSARDADGAGPDCRGLEERASTDL